MTQFDDLRVTDFNYASLEYIPTLLQYPGNKPSPANKYLRSALRSD